ncbi:Membrane protein, putative [plant metagenome]|uniref:Membrane protein, putative n=1 Tax=plant metagenome TaxID=1297885 RepID=A0A484XQE9_9ZZZZ
MSSPAATPSSRLLAIDALRGLVIVIMLLDHVRETVFLHHQVGDPMDAATTEPVLFFSRLLAHLCAPVFVFLTGLSAWLYGQKAGSTREVAAFLAKRGLFLVALEVIVVNFAWTGQFPPTVVYLQVIWAIGLSMLALAALAWLPRTALVVVGVALVAGHNALDSVHFAAGHAMHVPWAILHDRGWLEVGESLRLRTSYPVLPWIGVIALGYAAGPWFGKAVAPARRARWLWTAGLSALAAFIVLRALNAYGQAQTWQVQDTALRTIMDVVNITKYPPSLFFLLLTLGLGLLLLACIERAGEARWVRALCVYGAAPMFFYLLHLYVLKALYLVCVALWGLNQGKYFGVDGMAAVWLLTVLLAVALYLPVRAFGRLKARRRDIAWLKYL